MQTALFMQIASLVAGRTSAVPPSASSCTQQATTNPHALFFRDSPALAKKGLQVVQKLVSLLEAGIQLLLKHLKVALGIANPCLNLLLPGLILRMHSYQVEGISSMQVAHEEGDGMNGTASGAPLP